MKDGYYRIKTWEEMAVEFGSDLIAIYTSPFYVEDMEQDMTKDRIIKVVNGQWHVNNHLWSISKGMIKERIIMKKKYLLNRIEELEKKISELEGEKPVEEEQKHLELSVLNDRSKALAKRIQYAINGEWAYTAYLTTDRECNRPEENVMLYLDNNYGTWKDGKGNEVNGYLSYHPKGE